MTCRLEYRLAQLTKLPNFTFIKGNLADKALITELFAKYTPQIVVNLAAQAGVRYSITYPDHILRPTLLGFITFWKRAATRTITANRGWNTWSMPRSHPYMAPIKKSRMPWKIK